MFFWPARFARIDQGGTVYPACLVAIAGWGMAHTLASGDERTGAIRALLAHPARAVRRAARNRGRVRLAIRREAFHPCDKRTSA